MSKSKFLPVFRFFSRAEETAIGRKVQRAEKEREAGELHEQEEETKRC